MNATPKTNAKAPIVGYVEEVGHRHGTQHPIQMTIGTTDGNNVWAFRYSSDGDSRTLYYSSDVRALRELYPDRTRLRDVSDEHGSSSPNRLGISPEYGTRCPNLTTAWYGRVRTNCARSGRAEGPSASPVASTPRGVRETTCGGGVPSVFVGGRNARCRGFPLARK
jgi:hypothetical protein